MEWNGMEWNGDDPKSSIREYLNKHLANNWPLSSEILLSLCRGIAYDKGENPYKIPEEMKIKRGDVDYVLMDTLTEQQSRIKDIPGSESVPGLENLFESVSEQKEYIKRNSIFYRYKRDTAFDNLVQALNYQHYLEKRLQDKEWRGGKQIFMQAHINEHLSNETLSCEGLKALEGVQNDSQGNSYKIARKDLALALEDIMREDIAYIKGYIHIDQQMTSGERQERILQLRNAEKDIKKAALLFSEGKLPCIRDKAFAGLVEGATRLRQKRGQAKAKAEATEARMARAAADTGLCSIM